MMTAEEKAAQLELIFQAEQKRHDAVVKELAALRDLQFKQTERVHELKHDEQALVTAIQCLAQPQMNGRHSHTAAASQAALRNLGSRGKKLDNDLFQQQEVLYGQDFAVMGLQRKLARLEGFKPVDEQDKLRDQIAELQANLATEASTNTLLAAQLRKTDDETRQIRKALDRDAAEYQALAEKLWDSNLFIDKTEQHIKKSTTEKQDMMVDENILKLEIRRLRALLNQKADDVLSCVALGVTSRRVTLCFAGSSNASCSCARPWRIACRRSACTSWCCAPSSRPPTKRSTASTKVPLIYGVNL